MKEKSSTEKKEQDERPATEAQLRLIKALQEETNSEHLPEEYQCRDLNRSEASNCVQMLKDLKSRQYQERKSHETGVVFDKIGFGMVYKLVWKAASETPLAVKMERGEFEDKLCAEYKVFKDAQAACRQFVQDGGLK